MFFYKKQNHLNGYQKIEKMDVLVMAGQLILSLSILIVLHEMGHFFPAKWFKTRVEKFYLFFDPWFELFKKKVGETEYGIGWLPLGGYVKISGMVDESFDTEQLKQPPQPWEFRSKPAWQRLIIMVGGVTVNFILGFFLFSMILWKWGEDFIPAKNVKYGIYTTDSLGMRLGFQKGDKILGIGNAAFEEFNQNAIRMEIIINEARNIKVERAGQEVNLPVSDELAKELSKYKNREFGLFAPRMLFVLDTVFGASALKAGLKKSDKVIGIDSTPVQYFDEFKEYLVKLPKKSNISLTVERADAAASKIDTLSVALTTDSTGSIGVGIPLPMKVFGSVHKSFTFGEAVPAGISMGWNSLMSQVRAFGQMGKGKLDANDSLGSFFTIGKTFGGTWDWERFWRLTAFLSLVLGFINLLPIPALDGGHVMFLIWEVLTGRKPSDKVMEYSTMAGFVILIGIMLYAVGLDISRLDFFSK